LKNKYLIVSDIHHFSTKDMFDGYDQSFQQIGIDYDTAKLHELVNPSGLMHFSTEAAYGLTLAKLLNKNNGFTHCISISGLSLPEWFINSMYDKKLIVIASDDPHASKILKQHKDKISLWCSNCKNLNEYKIKYLPTATSFMLPKVAREDLPEKYINDIVFIGTVYESREKVLEEVCRYGEEKGLKVKIIGPLLRTDKDSIIRKYAEECIIDNKETKLFYRGAKVSINIDREVNWNPSEKNGNSLLEEVGTPYSGNPRMYEIAGCRSVQLFIDSRQEAIDIFGDNIYTSSNENIKEVLDTIFKERDSVLIKKINNCFEEVTKNHTYLNRTKTLLDYITESEEK
jgi:hypothetical protein